MKIHFVDLRNFNSPSALDAFSKNEKKSFAKIAKIDIELSSSKENIRKQ